MNADFSRIASAREEVSVVVAMQGDVEDPGIGIEDLLGRVAVMDVPVDDEDFAGGCLVQELFHCHPYRVEVTESPGGRKVCEWCQ